jgi:hypothetical protein
MLNPRVEHGFVDGDPDFEFISDSQIALCEILVTVLLA